MKKAIILLNVLILGLFLSVSMTSAFYATSEEEVSFERIPASLELKKERYMGAQLKSVYETEHLPLNLPPDSNIRITSSEGIEEHPALDIDHNDNPFLLYDYQDSSSGWDSDIFIQRSTDEGRSWPNDQLWTWQSPNVAEFSPDISIMADGLRAFGTHEVDVLEPTIYLHDYVNINNPDSWLMYYFDLAPETSYVIDTAVTTYGINTIALAGVIDLRYHEYDLEDTVSIYWNTEGGTESWPGLFVINTDNDGNTKPISHPTAGSGDKTFVAYQMEDTDGESDIYIAYCPSNDMYFENWRITRVSYGSGNAMNPSISVSGKYAYIVCEDDANGNNDVVCYSTTSGHYWRKHAVTNSGLDEVSPVITADGQKAGCLFVKNGNLYESKTEDGGLTWSDPIQINEIEGTVQDGYRAIDAAGIFGVWTDKRENEYELYIDEVGPSPVLTIGEIVGGRNIKTSVSNTGNAPASDLKWTIELDGFVIPESKTDRIYSLDVGETEEIKIEFYFGVGPIDVTVTAGHLVSAIEGYGFGTFIII